MKTPVEPGQMTEEHRLHSYAPVTTLLEDIKSYIGFGERDAAVLREVLVVARDHIPRIAEHFYEKILAHPSAHAAITGGTAQVDRLKGTLREWTISGLQGPHDEQFWERRSRIGRVHVHIGLPQRYMFTAMNVIRLDFREIVRDRMDPSRQSAANDALDRLFDLELAIMLHAYQVDSEARLRQRERARLTEKLQAVGTLSAGLAHEIRNPLNGAGLQLQLLSRRASRIEGGEGLKPIVTTVQTEIERLSNLVDDFLNFARPTNLRIQDMDLRDLVSHVVGLERLTAERAKVTLTANVPDDPLVVPGDRARLEQVVLNLVRNALEAVPEGGHVTVSTEPAQRGGAYLVIHDDGTGIPEELLPRIFEPFFSTKETGTGLGMAICHGLVTHHGGEIQVESRPGSTEFRVWLPPEEPDDRDQDESAG